MSATRICPGGGWLVSPPTPCPDDPADWYDPQSGAVVGCNRLSCYSCGAVVRSRLATLDEDPDAARIEQIWQADDWTAIDGVSESAQFRLYACRCSVWEDYCDTMTLDPDRDDFMRKEPPPWACQGHPEPTLPLDVDGFILATEADLDPLADRVLAGWSPRTGPPPSNFFPAVWAARVYRRLLTTPLAEPWAKRITAGLASPDPRTRGLSLHFLTLNPHAQGFEALLAEAEELEPSALSTVYRTWFGYTEDTPEEERPPETPSSGVAAWAFRPLLMRLCRATLPLDDLDVRARTLVRAAVLANPDVLDRESLGDLARADGEWLARNANKIVRGKTHSVYWLMMALRRARVEENLLIAGMVLLKVGARKRRELAAWLAAMPDDDSPYKVTLLQALAARGGA